MCPEAGGNEPGGLGVALDLGARSRVQGVFFGSCRNPKTWHVSTLASRLSIGMTTGSRYTSVGRRVLNLLTPNCI